MGWSSKEKQSIIVLRFVHWLICGASQPLDAKVLTPYGYREMGDFQIGDKVVGSDGMSTLISGIFPQGELDVYRVYFSDGTSVECSDDHLWLL